MKQTIIKPRNLKLTGFTLIELLVVVAIIAVLISLLLPSLNQARASAKKVQCMSNMKQIGVGLIMYENDYNGWPAFFFSWMGKYVPDTRLYICPSDGTNGKEKLSNNVQAYLYFPNFTDQSVPCSYWNYLTYIVAWKDNFTPWGYTEASYSAMEMQGKKPNWEWATEGWENGQNFTYARCLLRHPSVNARSAMNAIHLTPSGRVYSYTSIYDYWVYPDWYVYGGNH